MTVEHPDADVVTGGHRAAQQLIFTATQLVETIARMRQAAAVRRADAARAAADAAQRLQQSRQRTDRAVYTPAAAPGWRRDAEPVDLLTAWAAATTWAAHDPGAAAVMLHTEDEMRARWPQVIDHYDRVRVADGVHPAAAMTTALTHAASTGWNPAVSAAPPRDSRAQATTADATATAAATAPPAAVESTAGAPRPAAVNPAAQALRWTPAAGAATTPGQPRHRRAAPARVAARVPAPANRRGR